MGTIKIASQDPLGVPQANGVGTIVLEDLQNASAMQSLAVQVVPSSDALGEFNVTVGGVTLPKMVKIVKIEYMVPDDSGNPFPSDFLATSNPSPVIKFAQIPDPASVNIVNSRAYVQVSGTIRDALAEKVHNNVADIAGLDVYADGVFVRSLTLTRVAETVSFFRPHAHHMKFDEVIDFPITSSGATLQLMTSANGVGNIGIATLEVFAADNIPNITVASRDNVAASQVQVIDIEEGYATPSGPFTPVTVRVCGDSKILDGEYCVIGANEFLLGKKQDGNYWITGSDVHIMIVRSQTQIGNAFPTIIEYVVPAGEPATLKKQDKNFVQASNATLTEIDVLAGDIDVSVSVEVKRIDAGKPFEFSDKDSFAVVGPKGTITASAFTVDPKHKNILVGKVAKVDAAIIPGGATYILQLTTAGMQRDIPNAVVVNAPVHLILANMTGVRPGGIGDRATDADIVGCGNALLKEQTKQWKKNHEQGVVLRVSANAGGELKSWSELADVLQKRSINPGSVVSIDSLGHGGKNKGDGAIEIATNNKSGKISVYGGAPLGPDPVMPEATFSGYFLKFLTKYQPVNITLYHCWSALGNDGGTAGRLAAVLKSAKLTNVTVTGTNQDLGVNDPGDCTFTLIIDEQHNYTGFGPPKLEAPISFPSK